MFIGCTVAKQTVGDGVCEGTVVSFTTRKYSIEYTDGTTAALTRTALKKVLSLPPDAGTTAATDAPSAVGDGMPTATEADTEAPPEEGAAAATKRHSSSSVR